MKRKLNIASGMRPMSKPDNEWIDLDIRDSITIVGNKSYSPDVIADAKQIPYPNEYFVEILSHSILEHIGKNEFISYLTEWFRILKTGGILKLSVPDMKLVAKKLLSEDYRSQYEAINLIYGEQNYEENFHKWGYTEKSLKMTLEKVGFKNYKRLESVRYPEELFVKVQR